MFFTSHEMLLIKHKKSYVLHLAHAQNYKKYCCLFLYQDTYFTAEMSKKSKKELFIIKKIIIWKILLNNPTQLNNSKLLAGISKPKTKCLRGLQPQMQKPKWQITNSDKGNEKIKFRFSLFVENKIMYLFGLRKWQNINCVWQHWCRQKFTTYKQYKKAHTKTQLKLFLSYYLQMMQLYAQHQKKKCR